jgi:hypothetical protein
MRSIHNNKFDSAADLRTGQICLCYRLEPVQSDLSLLSNEENFGMT